MFRVKSSSGSLSLPRIVQRALLTLVICLPPTVHRLLATVSAQSPTAAVNGVVVDEKQAVVAQAAVTAVNEATHLTRKVMSNEDGYFTIPLLPPGNYTLTVEREGFAQARVSNLVLNVGDQRALQIQLRVGKVGETVTVVGESGIQESAAVGTVVDRQFVENIPLNGRSFQTLIALTPGVTFTKTAVLEQGQLSVNGQRSNANYFTVDGVSANFGISPTTSLGQTGSGALPALGVTGGTNTLVSADAVEEFRVQTFAFAPEFGRVPGGQISVATRSGGNDLHGSLFWYFRNDRLDANDWFANRDGLAKPRLRQNDFGGTLGGRLWRDRTFYFFAHESLRLRLPRVVVLPVPSIETRNAAPAGLRPYLNAQPTPNGPLLSGGFATFSASFSDASSLDATSIRLDHKWGERWNLFGRYNRAPSDSRQRAAGSNTAAVLSNTGLGADTLTFGLTGVLTPSIINELRGNYSRADTETASEMDDFGGATPLPDAALFPSFTNRQNGLFQMIIQGGRNLFAGRETLNTQQQINLTDSLSAQLGNHQLKFGVDYRLLLPTSDRRRYQQTVQFTSLGSGAGGALSGRPAALLLVAARATSLRYHNLSLYAQDAWRLRPRLTLTYGLRWEYNPPPVGRDGTVLTVFRDAAGGFRDIATLAPTTGAPVFNPTRANFAPRIGAAYQLSQKRGRELTLRGGYGLFYDLGSGAIDASLNPPYSTTVTRRPAQYPTDAATLAPPPLSLDPPYGSPFIADPDLKLPRAHQFSLALEQALGLGQSVSATYVGALGRKLLRTERLRNPRPDMENLRVTTNTSDSDYHALQLQFARRLSAGLQTLVSYSWAHSIDNLSSDFFSSPAVTVFGLDARQDRGPSDFDVRHALSGAVTYQLPSPRPNGPVKVIMGDWTVIGIFRAQTPTPFDPFTGRNIGFGVFAFRPDLVSGQPLYLFGSQYPGGKAVNRAAFVVPTATRQGTLGRNVLRGFPVNQLDFALRKQFRLSEDWRLEFGAEVFNLFNHPLFGDPVNNLADPLFGQSAQLLGRSLGSGGPGGGLDPLYHIGGPRSIQFSLKLRF
jgi:hypothetical protein